MAVCSDEVSGRPDVRRVVCPGDVGQEGMRVVGLTSSGSSSSVSDGSHHCGV